MSQYEALNAIRFINCSKCGQKRDKPCITPKGKERATHISRINSLRRVLKIIKANEKGLREWLKL